MKNVDLIIVSDSRYGLEMTKNCIKSAQSDDSINLKIIVIESDKDVKLEKN